MIKKTLFTLGIATLTANLLYASKPMTAPIKVQIAVPNPGWNIQINSVHTKNNTLLVVCSAKQKDGMFASVMSTAIDSVVISKELAKLPREIYITGTRWNYSEGYTPTTAAELEQILDKSTPVTFSTKKPTTKDFIGLTEAAAKQLAKQHQLQCRVVEVDGVSRMVTRDYRPKRLNFIIAKGKVIRVTKG